MPTSLLEPTKTTLQFKELRSLSTKVVSEGEGIVEALVAVTGNVDDGGDVILPGAFEFPEGRKAKIVWSHDMQVLCGKVLDAKELPPGDDSLPADLQAKGLGALWFKVQFDLEDPDGFKAYRKVKFHEDLGWSIGYQAPAGTFKVKDGVRLCSKIIVWEASPVTFGMNREARSLTVKSAFERVAQALPEGKRKAISDLLEALESTPDEGGEEKVWPPVPGSIEETRYLIDTALQVWAAEALGEKGEGNYWWVYLEATFEDTCVACVETSEGRTFMEFSYSVADGVVELGEPTEVELVTTVEVVGSAAASSDSGQTGSLMPKRFKPKETSVEEKAKAHKPHKYDDVDGSCQICGQAESNALHEDGEKAVGTFEATVKALEEDVAHLAAAVPEGKAGRVLARRNESRIRAALASIQEVLGEVAKDDDEEEKGGDAPEVKAAGPDDLLLLEAQMDLLQS